VVSSLSILYAQIIEGIDAETLKEKLEQQSRKQQPTTVSTAR
jgi:hypothetical protein